MTSIGSRYFQSEPPSKWAQASLSWRTIVVSLNAARIVYTVDSNDSGATYGFAYGTLVEHVEQGEERFTVEYDPANDAVWYDLFAFSKPRHPLARIAYPISRYLQRRFAQASLRAMLSAVNK